MLCESEREGGERKRDGKRERDRRRGRERETGRGRERDGKRERERQEGMRKGERPREARDGGTDNDEDNRKGMCGSVRDGYRGKALPTYLSHKDHPSNLDHKYNVLSGKMASITMLQFE